MPASSLRVAFPLSCVLHWLEELRLHLSRWPFLSNLSPVELGETLLLLSSEGGFRKE